MRVHFLGNTCNYFFLLCRYLRQLGIDAHLYHNRDLDIQTQPETDDPSVLVSPPEWIHPYRSSESGSDPWWDPDPQFLKRIADCDLIMAEDVGLIWAYKSGKPYIWEAYGYDLNFYSFSSHWLKQLSLSNPRNLLNGLLFREAARNANAFIYPAWDKNLEHGLKLVQSLLGRERMNTIGIPADPRWFKPASSNDPARPLAELLSGVPIKIEGLRIFHPTRVMFSKDSYVSKGTDILIRALGRLHREGIPFTYIIVEKGLPDEALAKQLIEALGFSHRVAWVPKMGRYELRDWYRAVDIVPDEFVSGAIASISLESLACGTPHLTYLRTQAEPGEDTFWSIDQTYPSAPPILNTKTEEDVYGVLKYYSENPKALEPLRAESAKWTQTSAAPETLMREFIKVFERVKAEGPRLRPLKSPTNSELQLEVSTLEQVTAELNRGDLRAALETVMLGIDQAHYSERLFLALTQIFEATGNAEAAAQLFAATLQIFPMESSLLPHFAALLGRMGLTTQAEQVRGMIPGQ